MNSTLYENKVNEKKITEKVKNENMEMQEKKKRKSIHILETYHDQLRERAFKNRSNNQEELDKILTKEFQGEADDND